MIVEDVGGILPLLEAEMASHGDLEIKDVCFTNKGVHEGVAFCIETLLLADGSYCARYEVGGRRGSTRPFGDVEQARQAGIDSAVGLVLEAVQDAS